VIHLVTPTPKLYRDVLNKYGTPPPIEEPRVFKHTYCYAHIYMKESVLSFEENKNTTLVYLLSNYR